MIPKEIFEKVHRIQITTSRLVSDMFAGQYHSVFKGRGMEFVEVREYMIGDDIRAIDWNVTARTGKPHIKKFAEERELTVMILVDVSMSCQFASVGELKSRLAAEVAAVLAFSAIQNNDKVGLIMFTDKIEKFIPPRKGLRHVLRVIRDVLCFKPEGQSTHIAQALEYLSKVTTHKTVSFLISDFYESNFDFNGQNDDAGIFKKTLRIASKRHDIVAVTLNDPREVNLPNCGLLELEDAETGKMHFFDSSDRMERERYHKNALIRLQNRERFFRSLGVDYVNISTDQPYSDALVRFFLMRRKRMR